MDNLLHSVNDVLAAQFLLDDSQSKVYAARDQFLYYVTKKLTHNDFSLEDENAVISLCRELNEALAQKPLTVNSFILVEDIVDKIKLRVGIIQCEEGEN